jgi:hypothetical protein
MKELGEGAINEVEKLCNTDVPYVLESNLHSFYHFRVLKNQLQIRFMAKSWVLEK